MTSSRARTSALRFGSESPISIIRAGSGYWKYVPTGDGIRFLTAYDYRTRFGIVGRLADRVAFRPLLGWATAWSFDRLRLWLEEEREEPKKGFGLRGGRTPETRDPAEANGPPVP